MSPASSKRKRHSAFDDFPVGNGALNETQRQPAVLQNLGTSPQPAVERIERLKPSQMIPDRFQPRRLLEDLGRASPSLPITSNHRTGLFASSFASLRPRVTVTVDSMGDASSDVTLSGA